MAMLHDKIKDEIDEIMKGHPKILPKILRRPLAQILDELDENNRTVAEVARRAEEAARVATKASVEAEKRAEEARLAGEKAAKRSIEAFKKSAKEAVKAMKAAMLPRIEVLEERLKNLEAFTPREEVVVIREISREEAKTEIERLFAGGKTLYYSDIAKELRLDLELVVDICEELVKEEKVKVAENSRKSSRRSPCG